MSETAFETGRPVNLELKRAALESVLHSHTFARTDQLKSFLKYVCEMEFAGRGHELTEYLIGVEALGRPSSFSPGDDSGVRNRAFALRKKLQEFYEHEQPDAAVRIELTKGSYCPHFVENHPPQKTNGNGSFAAQTVGQLIPISAQKEILPVQETEAVSKKAGEGRRLSALSFAAGVIFTAIVAGAAYWLVGGRSATTPSQEVPKIVAEAWGPILGPKSDVLICVANPPSFSVHPQAAADPTAASTPFVDPGGRPMPQELYDWYRTKYPASRQQDLFLTITTNYTYWGESLAAMTAMKTILAANASPHLFPEKVITMPTLRRRNVVLFGAPEYSPAVARFLEKCPLTVNFLEAIYAVEPGKRPVPLYAVKRDNRNSPAHTFGLITVLPSESSTGNQHRTIIFSGVNSAGAQAAAEFFTSPEHLAELKKQLKNDGHGTFPAAYQVVVRSETDDSILLNFRYETYRIIPMPATP